jgi:hypothetical protein
MSSITHKIPNHWVEKDAADRASHPQRSAAESDRLNPTES